MTDRRVLNGAKWALLVALWVLALCGMAAADIVFVAAGAANEIEPDRGALLPGGSDSPFTGYTSPFDSKSDVASGDLTTENVDPDGVSGFAPDDSGVDWSVFSRGEVLPEIEGAGPPPGFTSITLRGGFFPGMALPETNVDHGSLFMAASKVADEWQANRLSHLGAFEYQPPGLFQFGTVTPAALVFGEGVAGGGNMTLGMEAINTPEPGAGTLFALGLLGVVASRRRRGRRRQQQRARA